MMPSGHETIGFWYSSFSKCERISGGRRSFAFAALADVSVSPIFRPGATSVPAGA